MRVLCLVPYPTSGASNRLRVEQYVPLLRERGIELIVSSFLDGTAYGILYRPGHAVAKLLAVLRGGFRRMRDLLRARRFDLVLVHRESAPIGPPVVERVLGVLGVPYVYDFDDALFLAPVHPVNRRWAWLRHASRYADTATGAAAVVTVNEYLAVWARGYNDSVTVIPTPVDTERYRPRSGPRAPGPLVIGWIGSSTTAPYLHLLDEVFEVLARRFDLVVRVIGGRYEHATARVEVRPWDLLREPDDIASFDIGVLPEPDDAWTRGKGAFKGILYMAAGVPVVASTVGVNEEVLPDGEVGYCVGEKAGWIAAFERLVGDEALRARLGAAGRRRAISHYSVGVQAPRLAAVLESGVRARIRR